MKSIHILALFIIIGASHQNSEKTFSIDTFEQEGTNVHSLKNKNNNNEIHKVLKDEPIVEKQFAVIDKYNLEIDQNELDFSNTNHTYDKESMSLKDANKNENSPQDDDLSATNDDKTDMDDYFKDKYETEEETNETDTADQLEDDKSDEDQIDFKSKMKEILENLNEPPNMESDEESPQVVVISMVDAQPEQESYNQQQQQELEQASGDIPNDQKVNIDQPDDQPESTETKPLILFKIRPIQRVFDRVLDTESSYYYRLLEMYEGNALDSEKKYYQRIYKRFGAKMGNDQIGQEQKESDQEEEESEEGEHEGELNLDEILYRKNMLDNGENYRNEIMQLIMNKIQRIETLIISSFQLLLVLSIFLIVVQFLILLNNLMKKSKHRVYQHRLIAKTANNNYMINDSNGYAVKSKHDILNV